MPTMDISSCCVDIDTTKNNSRNAPTAGVLFTIQWSILKALMGLVKKVHQMPIEPAMPTPNPMPSTTVHRRADIYDAKKKAALESEQ